MHYKRRLLKLWLNHRSTKLSATKIIAVAFAAAILIGTLLLMLPISSRSGVSCGFLTALFTSTSATCVTGLVLYDTWIQWSGFGQIVILALIELGGLGVMSAASLVVFMFRKKVGLKQRMLMAQAMSLNDLEGVVRLQRMVIQGSILIELTGALILTIRFLPEYGPWCALRWGVFHAVSAFCNAGFDIFGVISPGGSAMVFGTDPVVLLTLSVLIILGGLGFFVWEELIRVRRFKKLSVYSRLVLITTALLLLTGMTGYLILEWNNPATLGSMTVPQKFLAAFFQSTTVRTAGFAGIDQGMLTESSKAFTLFYMLIGGSSGSTAGGVKTATIVVLFLFLWTRARGRENVNLFKRSIPKSQVLDAATIVMTVLSLAFVGGVFVSATSHVPFLDAIFETVSAIATVGLSTGITPTLSISSKILIIIFMYFGRVGVLTISLGFLMGDRASERFQYAQTKLLIG